MLQLEYSLPENPILISMSFHVVFFRASQNEYRFGRLVLGSDISETSNYVRPVTKEITQQGLGFRGLGLTLRVQRT